MGRTGDKEAWTPTLRKSAGPAYLAIVDALSDDILSGNLAAGVRLPTQRKLADALGIHFTTVTRAYEEARRRGLVEGRVGQGTYVRPNPRKSVPLASAGLVDMSMNLPPRFDDAGLLARMWSGIASLELGGGVDLLFRYQTPGGAEDDKAAGALWLGDRLPSLDAGQILVCPGTQGALLAVVGLLAGAGDTICTETLTYPGFRALAAHLKIRLVAAEIDEEGLIPDAFDAVCRTERPKALYCTPTLHNPTTATMSLQRREAIVAVARNHGVPIIEDDVYGRLPRRAPPPLAALGPEIVYYIGGLAKCLSPALRIAYLVPPDMRAAARLSGAIRAISSLSSPLTAAIATRWIQNGTADAVLAAIRKETIARQQIAKAILPPGSFAADPEGFHLWLSLVLPWTRAEFAGRLRSAGIGVVSSDAFALGIAPDAVRIGLGAPVTAADLRTSLHAIANLLAEQPALSSMVV
jgi:DNA-binding transcriptional MocR family regulator